MLSRKTKAGWGVVLHLVAISRFLKLAFSNSLEQILSLVKEKDGWGSLHSPTGKRKPPSRRCKAGWV